MPAAKHGAFSPKRSPCDGCGEKPCEEIYIYIRRKCLPRTLLSSKNALWFLLATPEAPTAYEQPIWANRIYAASCFHVVFCCSFALETTFDNECEGSSMTDDPEKAAKEKMSADQIAWTNAANRARAHQP